MPTLILLLRRKRGLSKEQFREHYENSHVPLGKKYLGHLFQDYRRHYIGSALGIASDGHSIRDKGDDAFDAITVITFANQAALDEFFRIVSQPDVSAALREDEERFLDRPAMLLNIGEEVKTWTAADVSAFAARAP